MREEISHLPSARSMVLRKILFILLGIVIVALALVYVYYQNSTPLTFQTASKQGQATENQIGSPQIVVVTEIPAQPVYGIRTADQEILRDTDYSKYFLVIALFGFGSSEQDEVTKLWQHDHDFWVQATFATPPDNSEKVSPYQIIKITRSELTHFGSISFRLLDDQKMDKAKAEQTITVPTS